MSQFKPGKYTPNIDRRGMTSINRGKIGVFATNNHLTPAEMILTEVLDEVICRVIKASINDGGEPLISCQEIKDWTGEIRDENTEIVI